MAAHTLDKRSSASIWVQVDAPGEWYIHEVRRSLKGLHLPFAVTRARLELKDLEFSRPPTLLYSRSQRPPEVVRKSSTVSQKELRCLQALGRMEKGDMDEIASLTGHSMEMTKNLIGSLEKRKLVVYKIGEQTQRDKTKPAQMDLFPLWHIELMALPFLVGRP